MGSDSRIPKNIYSKYHNKRLRSVKTKSLRDELYGSFRFKDMDNAQLDVVLAASDLDAFRMQRGVTMDS